MGRFGINMVQEKGHIGSGNGYLKVGTSWSDLQDLGSLEGNASVVITREYLDVFDGQPLVLIDKHVIREGARIQCTLKEKRLRDIAWQLGLLTTDCVSSEAAAPATAVTGEQKVLLDENWAHLDGTNISSVIVTDGGATPATYTLNTDYALDTVRGLIRRISGGLITDGGRVYVAYSWSRPARLKLLYGQDNVINPFKLRFVYTQIDGNRQITDFLSAVPAESVVQGYNVGALNTRDLVFDALADLTANPGERLYRQYHEGATV